MKGFLTSQAKVVEDLKQQAAKYEAEILAQSLAMEGLAREREASKAGALESADRAKVLRPGMSITKYNCDHASLCLLYLHSLVGGGVISSSMILLLLHQAFAEELISLEEQIHQLRSQELKMQRELEVGLLHACNLSFAYNCLLCVCPSGV